MRSRQRTYEWVNGTLIDVDAPIGDSRDARRAYQSHHAARQDGLGVQDLLLLFTFSSVLFIFAGLGLFAFCVVFYSIVFK